MESGEHMPDKPKFPGELARVAAPGGTIIIVTWCHRDLGPAEESLQPWEQNLLKRICDAFYLPAWCSTADYVKLLESHSLQDIKSADWSPFVASFWLAVMLSTYMEGSHFTLAQWNENHKRSFGYAIMIEGFKKGVIKFAIVTCSQLALQSCT